MAGRVRNWISIQIDLGKFDQRSAVYSFALKMAFRAVLLAMPMILWLLFAFRQMQLQPMPVMQIVWLAVAISWVAGGGVSGALGVLTGQAIFNLSRSSAEFERLSRTDMLSGLLNRRAFSEILLEAGEPASLVIFDVDRFKLINDRFGHSAGDAVIRDVSALIAGAFPENCTIARLGGEEFGVIIPGYTLEQRLQMVNNARNIIGEGLMAFDEHEIRVTISAGVAEFSVGRAREQVYAGADKALYLAKTAGRNRVVHEQDMPLTIAVQGRGGAGAIEGDHSAVAL